MPGGIIGVGGGASISYSRTCIPGPQCNLAIANQNAIQSRGEPGVLAARPTDVAPLYGSISFNSPSKSLFYVGDDPDAIPSGSFDFFSIATHELAHAIGFGISESWNTLASTGSFAGPEAKTQYVGSGNVPLTPAHWATSVAAAQPTLMGPVIQPGTRTLFSDLDFAAMKDIGWEVTDTTATVTASHRYLDDGVYTPRILLSGSRLGTRSEEVPSVSVTNVAPSLSVAANQTVLVGNVINIEDIATFTDPGDETQYTYSIDWGDGEVQDGRATIDRRADASGKNSAGSLDGNHTYASEGPKTVSITVSDEDGGIATGTLLIDVVPLPRISLEVDRASVVENDGADAATLTVRRSGAASDADTLIAIASSDPSEATVPSEVVIPAGSTLAAVQIAAVDDALLDGNQTVTFSASASGLEPGSVELTVNDFESLVVSVTGTQISENAPGDIALVITRSNTDIDEALDVSLSGFANSQLDLDGTVVIPAGAREVRIPVVPVDDSLPELTETIVINASAPLYASGSAEFEVLDDESPKFQNSEARFDVNAMNGVTALDALRVINRLAVQSSPRLDPADPLPDGLFLDVNGDYLITAIDALQIINELARQTRSNAVNPEAIDEVMRSSTINRANDLLWLDDEKRRGGGQRVTAFDEVGSTCRV